MSETEIRLASKKLPQVVSEISWGITMSSCNKRIGVAGWKTKMVEELPGNFHGSLPSVEEIEAELSGTVTPRPVLKKKKA